MAVTMATRHRGAPRLACCPSAPGAAQAEAGLSAREVLLEDRSSTVWAADLLGGFLNLWMWVPAPESPNLSMGPQHRCFQKRPRGFYRSDQEGALQRGTL